MNQQITKHETESPVRPVRRTSSSELAKPPVQVWQDADGYTIEAEMPGVARDGVEVTFDDGKLTLVGHRRSREVESTTIHRESRIGDFSRVFELDSSVDSSRIAATVEQGVLRVYLPKAEQSKPRRIEIG